MMAEKRDLAATILLEAGRLFRRQGYEATSIKQIAKAAGCTTAALYYHFEGGKSEILHKVILSYRHQEDILAAMRGAGSLSGFLSDLGTALAQNLPAVADQVNWLMLQFPTLPEEEKQVLQGRLLFIKESIRLEIGRFVPDGVQADRLAWLVFGAFYGFFQLSTKMELGQVASLDLEGMGGLLAEIVGDDCE